MADSMDPDSSAPHEDEACRQQNSKLRAEAEDCRKLQERLSEELSFRTAVIENAAEGICVCHSISESPFVEFTIWNQRMIMITGYTMEEINRFGWYQTMYPDPDIREQAKLRMDEMREGKDLKYEKWEIRRADGQTRVVGISTAILTTHDMQVHVLALMHDITNEINYRRQLETRLSKLEGLLPICASCKKIRDANDTWHQLEVYISTHSEAEFTHSICPECTKQIYEEIDKP